MPLQELPPTHLPVAAAASAAVARGASTNRLAATAAIAIPETLVVFIVRVLYRVGYVYPFTSKPALGMPSPVENQIPFTGAWCPRFPITGRSRLGRFRTGYGPSGCLEAVVDAP